MNLDALLIGEHVRLFPYRRELYPRSTLYDLWCLVEADGASASLFYAQECTEECTRGDLVEWVRYFSDETRHLIIVTTREGTDILGLVWLDRIAGQSHALIGLWYKRKTTRLAREGTALACRYAFEVLGYDALYGWTPHTTAVRHVLSIGWQKIATLPQMVVIAGQRKDVYICRRDKGRSALRVRV